MEFVIKIFKKFGSIIVVNDILKVVGDGVKIDILIDNVVVLYINYYVVMDNVKIYYM